MSSHHKSRFDPTAPPAVPPWPPHLTELPDLRPVGHPLWDEFRAVLAAAGFGLHLTASAEQFERQGGPMFWRFFLLAKGETILGAAPCSTTTPTSATT